MIIKLGKSGHEVKPDFRSQFRRVSLLQDGVHLRVVIRIQPVSGMLQFPEQVRDDDRIDFFGGVILDTEKGVVFDENNSYDTIENLIDR